MTTFLGIDLGWYGKPTGLASLRIEGGELRLIDLARIAEREAIFEWVAKQTGNGDAVAAVDAPLVIPNALGIRQGERELNREFQKHHAGCHPANLSRPFAPYVTGFSRELEELGFRHGPGMAPKARGRYQIEVHPHAATVSMFRLDRIVKYKKGNRAAKAGELNRLRDLCLQHFPSFDPPLTPELPEVPLKGPTKPAEDQIDAVICAYIAAHWWHWASERNTVFGTAETGYVVVPRPVTRVTAPRFCS